MTGQRRAPIHVFLVIALATTAAACSPGTTAAPTVPASPAATPAASAATAPEPCATATIVNCQTPAGTYHASRIGGGVTFQLIGEPWMNLAYRPEALTFHRGATWVLFMHAALNMSIDGGVDMVSDPGTAKLRLDSLPGITVKTGNPVSIGGHEAAVIDLINEGATTMLWHNGQTTDNYILVAGNAVRIHWIDLDGTPFLLLLEAPKAEIATFLTESQPVIDSIAFD